MPQDPPILTGADRPDAAGGVAGSASPPHAPADPDAQTHRRALLAISRLVLECGYPDRACGEQILALVGDVLGTRVQACLEPRGGRFAIEAVVAAPPLSPQEGTDLCRAVQEACATAGPGPAATPVEVAGLPPALGLRAHLCCPFGGGGGNAGGALFLGCATRAAWSVPEVEFAQAVGQLLQIARRRHADDDVLRQADRRKDEFLATLAHELRNPLGAIANGLAVLDAAPDAAGAVQVRQMMARQLGHAVRLIDDLLDLARIREGKLALQLQAVSLQEVLQTAVDASRTAIEAKRHALEVRLPAATLWARADPSRLCQVVANLLTNAARYTSRGGHIRLALEADGGLARISVADDGVGLSAEHLESIFTLYMQVAATRVSEEGGLGIGLALVRSLVQLHGGQVRVRSEGLGKGSTFTVELPLAAPPRRSGAARQPVPARVDAQAPTTRQRILIVDDNTDAATAMALLLGLQGYEVRTASDGRSALATCAVFAPDLVFLDIGLPDQDGYAIARRLKADPRTRSIRLVALTGWGRSEDRARALDAGFDSHVTKPPEFRQLQALLADLLGRPGPGTGPPA